MQLPEHVLIKEVGPRDGLQNEKIFIPTDTKIEWINRLSKTGLTYIEITSFVNPKWIPALEDAFEVATRIERVPGITYAALVPNSKGLQRALESDVNEVSVFMSASETHNRKNINKSIQDTFPVLEEVVKEANDAGKKVRGYVSTVFGCPYEGKVLVDQVKAVTHKLLDMGVYEVSLGDTIGIANPKQMDVVLRELKKLFSVDQLALHLHDTRGMALANTLVGLHHGISTYDSALGGLGGCPYARGASGNVASEDLIYMLEKMEINTRVNFPEIMKSAQFIAQVVNKALPSHQLGITEA